MICSDLYRVEIVNGQEIELDVLAHDVSQDLADDIQITGVSISDDPSRTYQFSISKPSRTSLYVDQYTGEVKGMSKRMSFFQTVFKLHRWLMGKPINDDGKMGFGKLVIGISTLLFVIVLITGVIVWMPRNKAMLKSRFKITFSKGWRRFYYDLHVAGGIYAVLILLALSLTGLTWSFSWYKKAFYKALGTEVVERPRGGRQGKSVSTADFSQWQKVYDELAVRNPEYSRISISNGEAQVYFDRWGNQRASDTYIFDTSTGEITEFTPYKSLEKSRKVGGLIYSIHVGTWGGLLSRLLTFFAAIFGSTLPLTGYFLWIKRRFFSKNKYKPQYLRSF